MIENANVPMKQATRTTGSSTPSPSSHGTSRSSGRKTKSKFSKKHRKPQKPQVAPSGPVYTYVSKCCNAPARKPKAFSAIAGKKDKTGLGHWHCSACGKIAKVSVGKPKAEGEYTADSIKVLAGMPPATAIVVITEVGVPNGIV